MGIRCADHVTPLYPQKLALTSPTGGDRSIVIVRSRTKATEFFFLLYLYNIFSHSPVRLTTGPDPYPKRVLHIVRSDASSLNFRHPIVSLSSASSCLSLLHRLPVTSVLPYIFPSIMRFLCRERISLLLFLRDYSGEVIMS